MYFPPSSVPCVLRKVRIHVTLILRDRQYNVVIIQYKSLSSLDLLEFFQPDKIPAPVPFQTQFPKPFIYQCIYEISWGWDTAAN